MRPRAQNPANRFHATHLAYDEGEAPSVPVTLIDDASRSIVSENDSPDVGFRFSVNPYRGCYHACAYCYARPTHEVLGYGAGTDFERTLVVKRAAAELLRARFDRPSWTGEHVVFSGVTDPYQPVERELGLTRACLEVCAEYRNPVGIITKSVLVERDVQLLVELHERASLQVFVSVPFASEEVARALEPYAPTPTRRLRTIERLAAAGLRVGVSVSPLVPGLGEDDLRPLLAAARSAGATSTFAVALRLPGAVREVFLGALRERLPLRAKKVEARLRELHRESLYDARFLVRQRGVGVYAEALRALYEGAARSAGLSLTVEPHRAGTFRRPDRRPQLRLFGD